MSARTTYEDKARELVPRCRPTKPWGPIFDDGPEFARGIIEAGRIQDQFVSEFGVKPCRWFWPNRTRLVNRTFDTPYKISAKGSIIDRLTGGSGDDFGRLCDRILNYGEAFDHADFWSCPGCPCVMVGHPSHLCDEDRVLIDGTFKGRAGGHGCQMPEQLLGRIIRACSNEGQLVLDPLAGSGTMLVVAKRLGRRYLGFEIWPAYVAGAQSRLDAAPVGHPLEGSEEPLGSGKRSPKPLQCSRFQDTLPGLASEIVS